MTTIKHYLYMLLVAAVASMALTACSDDDLGETIFPDVNSSPDPNSSTYALDKFLWDNYLVPYNLEFKYRLADDSYYNMYYNVVPATYDVAKDMAVLCKYLWFDAYDAVTPADFMKSYGPRIIQLVGSPIYNTTSSTVIYGLAQGGIKISLYGVNFADAGDADLMTTRYFATMHHEFTHILHQTKTYPSAFNYISVGHYDGTNWQYRQDSQMNGLGFVTSYASSSYTEDLAETVANYVVLSDEQWNRILDYASRGWATADADDDDPSSTYFCFYYYENNEATDENRKYAYESQTEVLEDGTRVLTRRRDTSGNYILVYDVEDTDGVDGVVAINQKLEIVKNWFRTTWGFELDSLRNEVHRRMDNLDIDELRKQIAD